MFFTISNFALNKNDLFTYTITPGAYLQDKLTELLIPFKLDEFYGAAKPLCIYKNIDKLEDLNAKLFTEGLDELANKLIQIVILELKIKTYKEIHIRSDDYNYISLKDKKLK